MKKTILRVCLLMAILAIQSASIHAQLNAFTYQGSLKTGGTAVSGLYDFEFDICDAPAGGTILSTQARVGVSVTNGIFTVNLTASPTIFSGGARYLEIRVKPSGGAAFDSLAPRQLITSAPYALKSFNATNAEFSTEALNASNALNANNATNAVTAQTATTAGFATNAQSAITAQTATTATTALNSNNLGGLAANQYFRFKWNVIDIDIVASPNQGYIIGGGGETGIRLPTSPQIGDVIRITSTGNGSFTLQQNAGQQIIQSYTTASNVWIPRDGNRNWQTVASSADGTKLVATANDRIYISIDSGLNWTPRELIRNFSSAAISADGSKMVVGDSGGGVQGRIYTSSDSGVTWTPRENARRWVGVASSSDGVKLVAINQGGQIYTSTDSGITWTEREANRQWAGVASSSDGSKLIASLSIGEIFTSIDSGVTWTGNGLRQNWRQVASSADGSKLVATVSGGAIYTRVNSQSEFGINGRLAAAPGSSVELVYAGGGLFLIVGSTGNISLF